MSFRNQEMWAFRNSVRPPSALLLSGEDKDVSANVSALHSLNWVFSVNTFCSSCCLLGGQSLMDIINYSLRFFLDRYGSLDAANAAVSALPSLWTVLDSCTHNAFTGQVSRWFDLLNSP